jgi:hypothetical protein
MSQVTDKLYLNHTFYHSLLDIHNLPHFTWHTFFVTFLYLSHIFYLSFHDSHFLPPYTWTTVLLPYIYIFFTSLYLTHNFLTPFNWLTFCNSCFIDVISCSCCILLVLLHGLESSLTLVSISWPWRRVTSLLCCSMIHFWCSLVYIKSLLSFTASLTEK